MQTTVSVGSQSDSCGQFPPDPQLKFDSQYDFVLLEPLSIGQNVLASFDGVVPVASIYGGSDGQGVIYDLGPSRGRGLFFRVEEPDSPVLIQVTLQGSV